MTTGNFEQTLIAVFQDPPPKDIQWVDVLSVFDRLEIAYREIDERVNIVIYAGHRPIVHTGKQPIRQSLQRNVGAMCLAIPTVYEVRHLLLMSGFAPRT